MMNEKPLIFAGLAVFLLAFSYPFWQITEDEAIPQIAMETKGEECVAPVEYMRKNHMKLLDIWTDSVVRDGDRFHIMPDGSKVENNIPRFMQYRPRDGADGRTSLRLEKCLQQF
jgi:hypothetical protein